MANDNKKYIPALRFPEFQNDVEWITDTMENLFDIKNGYTPSKSNPSFWDNGTIPWFRMEDIRKNGHVPGKNYQKTLPNPLKYLKKYVIMLSVKRCDEVCDFKTRSPERTDSAAIGSFV